MFVAVMQIQEINPGERSCLMLSDQNPNTKKGREPLTGTVDPNWTARVRGLRRF